MTQDSLFAVVRKDGANSYTIVDAMDVTSRMTVVAGGPEDFCKRYLSNAEDSVRDIAHKVASDKRFALRLRTDSQLYYSSLGDPGVAVWADSQLSAYIEARLQVGGFEVTVDDRGTGTTTSKSFGDAADATEYAVSELLYRKSR